MRDSTLKVFLILASLPNTTSIAIQKTECMQQDVVYNKVLGFGVAYCFLGVGMGLNFAAVTFEKIKLTLELGQATGIERLPAPCLCLARTGLTIFKKLADTGASVARISGIGIGMWMAGDTVGVLGRCSFRS